MTDELTLIEFLRACLDEDERVASDVHEAECAINRYAEGEYMDFSCNCDRPARVLAEVAAKRAILDAYDQAHVWYTKNPTAPAGEVAGLYTAIQHLAQPYTGQPGWRDEWTVTG